MKALIVLLAMTGVAHADSVAGTWAGAIELPGQKLDITIVFDDAGAGTIDIPQQAAEAIPLAKVVVADGTHVTFEIPVVSATFDGKLDGDAIAGSMTQAGQTFPFHLARAAALNRKKYVVPEPALHPLAPEVGRHLLGAWDGIVHDPRGDARIHVRFDVTAGVVTAIVDQQGSCEARPTTALTLTFDKVHLEINEPDSPPVYFDGRLDGDTIAGAVFHGGHESAAELHRARPAPARPYREVEVSVVSTGGTVLRGTLTEGTDSSERWPVVVMITGSGAEDRDECVFGIRPFAQLADHLARHHIASLRLDDRGTAKSTGTFAGATTGDFADDAEAALAFAVARPELDGKHAGLLGHSEGGIVAPMVAARNKAVAFVVLWAGPGLPFDQVLAQQAADIAAAEGADPAAIALEQRQTAVIWKAWLAAKDEASFAAGIKAGLAKLPKKDLAGISDVDAWIAPQVKRMWSPWFRWYQHYDPRKTLAKVTVPVLAVNGGMDKQVSAKSNLAAIRLATKRNQDVKLVELPDLNHMFQHTATGAVSEYAKNPPELDPSVLDTTTDWIVEHTKN